MPFLEQQIKIVNQELLATALADERFRAGRFETIANDVIRTDKEGSQMFPAINSDNNYQALEISPDDTWPIIIYHKIKGKSYGIVPNQQFGSRNGFVAETVQVKMVVYAKYSAIKMTKEQLEALIITNFPDNMDSSKNALLPTLKLDNLTYAMQSSDMVSQRVWQEEYKGVEYAMAPEDIYFSITYTIQSQWRKGCFKICDCN